MRLEINLSRQIMATLLATAITSTIMPARASGKVLVPFWPVKITVNLATHSANPCGTWPKAVKSLATKSRYDTSDASRTSVDPAAEKQYNKLIAPVREFSQKLVGFSNSFATTGGRNTDGAFCTIKGLSLWAKGKALTDAQTDIANFNRATFLVAVSSAYIQVKQSVLLTSTDKAAIETWIGELTRQSRVFYQAKRDALQIEPNNIQYWGGLGIAMAGVALNKSDDFDWGVSALPLGACTATKEGALPREIAREERAQHYHLFALQPLVGLAELAERNGRPGYSVCDGALHRIIKFTLDSVDNPAMVEALAGKKQLTLGKIKSDNDFAWLEIYASRFPQFQWASRLPSLRPFSNTNLGGKITALYAVK